MKLSYKNWKFQLTAALALLAGSAVVAVIWPWSQLETSIFKAVYDQPPFARQVFQLITAAGGSLFFLLVLFYLLRKSDYKTAFRLFLAGFAASLLAGLIKQIVSSPRPAQILADFVVHDVRVSGMGFPSGHTAIATLIGLTLISHLPPRRRWLVPAGIVLVAWSRMYLGAHSPLDLIGGFALGWIVWLLFNNVNQTAPRSGLKKSP